jgi:AraC-like DNA-binding protein
MEMAPIPLHEQIEYKDARIHVKIREIQYPPSDNISRTKGWHFHSEVELLLILRGKLTLCLSEETILLKEGDIAIIGSGEPHRAVRQSVCYLVLQFDLAKHIEQAAVDYSGVFLTMVRPMSSLNRMLREDPEATRKIVDSILEIRRESLEHDRGYELAISKNISGILIALLRADRKGLLLYSHDARWRRIQPVLEYVEKRLDEKIDTREVCALIHISYHYFNKLFRKCAGLTFSNYVELRRIRRAEQLLLTEDLCIAEITARVGLANVSHFYELFRRFNGCTPGEFRSRKNGIGQ